MTSPYLLRGPAKVIRINPHFHGVQPSGPALSLADFDPHAEGPPAELAGFLSRPKPSREDVPSFAVRALRRLLKLMRRTQPRHGGNIGERRCQKR